MPWQGQKDNIIDRFDARAHLDCIPPPSSGDAEDNLSNDQRVANYERYRILAQNEFLGISEEKFLQQLHLEEQYGVNAQQEAERAAAKKAQKPQTGAAIGYTYEDSTGDYPNASGFMPPKRSASPPADEESDSDLDVDVCININKLDVAQGHELNKFGRNYGMLSNDFYSFLTRDADEADAMRLAREEEQEKVLMGGRKSRRERRAQREKFTRRFQSPPSYASKEEDFRDLLATKGDQKDEQPKRGDENESRSPSPVNSGVITYITSFGGDDETPGPSASAALKPGKSHTMTKLQQLKSQLTLGSIIGEKRDALAASGSTKLKSETTVSAAKTTTSSATGGRAEIIGKPVSYRSTGGDRRRSRSPRGRNKSSPRRFSRSRRSRQRRDRYNRDSVSSRSSRSRSVSSRSRSSSRERQREYNQSDRRRRSLSRGRQEQRGRRSRRRSSSYSSNSSSSTSTSSSSRRSYSKDYRRNSRSRKKSSTPKLKQPPPQREKTQTKESPKSVPKVVSPEPPAIKLPDEVVVIKPATDTPTAVQVAIPVVSEEVQAPVKKYYGRKKDDHSNSELSFSEEENDKEVEQKTSTSRNVERQQKTESNS